ncbi:RNA polymerase sigma factor [Dyadobacter fanqingshengii]|uniref:Sigma-70 family RNA polymerase sigma factor n=1 Tax=Dyadobacter fanqingshengii TaxID=2906443 RepID=A0A9X1P906_9BACT|nr:sigma-70 family RNA polymerase sigma factor [Dyadobacter fanqingshengii]MCF0040247.1 sigma-70 family RNA polymerase sigma factor [Dyadobacter fanqingshengii]USJ38005.1 sigma-70 family RNA polymerase sigma factor [Dyadobacter fanqingshengii]
MNKQQRIAEENVLLLNLWQQSQAGDSLAFCQLADKQYRTLFNYATNFTSDREFIKDSIQELLIHIWEKRQTIHIQFVSIYFLKALRNQLLQEFRRNNPANSLLDIDEVGQISDYQTVETEIEQSEIYSENQIKVRSAINELPRRQKEVVFLKYFEGMDNEQIADLMQVNRQSVANLLFKAITSLKTHIRAVASLILIFVVNA